MRAGILLRLDAKRQFLWAGIWQNNAREASRTAMSPDAAVPMIAATSGRTH